MQLRGLGIVLCSSFGFSAVDKVCTYPTGCSERDEAETDVTSLVQTGSWVRAKSGNSQKQGQPSQGDLALLQTQSAVQEVLPEDFFQEDSLDPASVATTEHRLLKNSISTANEDPERKSALSYIQHPAVVVDGQGNHSTLLLQTARKQLKEQEEGDCTPKCTWKCSSQKCDEVCAPKCKPPICETRCSAMETSSCTLDCDQPDCAVICPETQCTTGCHQCHTACSKPQCKLKCPGAQPCRNVCEEPECEWQCSAPKVCPAPKCWLQCEKPPSRMQTYHAPLPALKSGEVTIKSFNAGGAETYPCDATVATETLQNPEYPCHTPSTLPDSTVPATITRENEAVMPATITGENEYENQEEDKKVAPGEKVGSEAGIEEQEASLEVKGLQQARSQEAIKSPLK